MTSISEEEVLDIRRRLGVTVTGDGRSPVVPLLRLADLRLPLPYRAYLSSEKITEPTSIQSQALPLMFMGRGMCSIEKLSTEEHFPQISLQWHQ